MDNSETDILIDYIKELENTGNLFLDISSLKIIDSSGIEIISRLIDYVKNKRWSIELSEGEHSFKLQESRKRNEKPKLHS